MHNMIKQILLKENYWTMVKIIISVISRTWNHDEEMTKMCSTSVESLPNRVHMLVQEKTGHICYELYHILNFSCGYLNKTYFDE